MQKKKWGSARLKRQAATFIKKAPSAAVAFACGENFVLVECVKGKIANGFNLNGKRVRSQ